jgi:hypothetical protein
MFRISWTGGPGVSSPEISNLTHKQPQPHHHDYEDFVPGGDFSSLLCAILFVIMKADRLNTPTGILCDLGLIT